MQIQSLLKKIPQNELTSPLILIILFLLIVAFGNLLGIYNGIKTGSHTILFLSTVSFFVYVVPACGLLFLKTWARYLEIFISLLTVFIFSPFLLLEGNNLFISILSLIIHGYIVFYLTSSQCKSLFARFSTTPRF